MFIYLVFVSAFLFVIVEFLSLTLLLFVFFEVVPGMRTVNSELQCCSGTLLRWMRTIATRTYAQYATVFLLMVVVVLSERYEIL